MDICSEVQWEVIPEYPNYMIGSNGVVHSMNIGRALRQSLNENGYPYVNLSKGGKGLNKCVHRLVAIAFVLNPDNLPQVNHKDLDKTNNHYKNLEWSTGDSNRNHAADALGMNRKKPLVAIPESGVGLWYPSLYSAMKDGWDGRAISKSTKRGWKHHGFKWSAVQ